MSDIGAIIELLSSADTKQRLSGSEAFLSAINDPNMLPDDFLDCLGEIVKRINAMAKSSNFKVSLCALEIMHSLAIKLPADHVRHFVHSMMHQVIERFGDSKVQVRDMATAVALSFIDTTSVDDIAETLLTAGLAHKNWRARETCMNFLASSVFVAESAQRLPKASPFVTAICKQLEDREPGVREAASHLLVALYQCFGANLRSDIMTKTAHMPKSRVDALVTLLDNSRSDLDDDSTNASSSFATATSRKQRSGSAGRSSGGRSSLSTSLNTSAGSTSLNTSRDDGLLLSTAEFESFDDCAAKHVASDRELADTIHRIGTILSDDKKDWSERIKSLRLLRSLLNGGATEHDNFPALLAELKKPLCVSIEDLRSQVTREASITIAHLAHSIGDRLDLLSVVFLPILLKTTYGSIKIMAQSADMCIRQIILHCHSHRLLPVLLEPLTTSKSASLRANCADYLALLLTAWWDNDSQLLDRNVGGIESALRKGLTDADTNCRAASRRAFWGFHLHYPSKAAALRQGLDATALRLLDEEKSTVESGSGRAGGAASSSSSSQHRPVSGGGSRAPLNTSASKSGPRRPKTAPGPSLSASTPGRASTEGSLRSATSTASASSHRSASAGLSASASSAFASPSSGPKRVSATTNSSNSSSSSSGARSTTTSAATSGARRVTRPDSSSSSSSFSSSTQQSSSSNSRPSTDSLSSLERSLKSFDWEARDRAFQSIASFPVSATLSPIKLLSLTLTGYNDANSRVVCASIDSTCHLLNRHFHIDQFDPATDPSSSALDALFFRVSADSPSSVRSRVKNALSALESSVPASNLFTASLKVLTNSARAPLLSTRSKALLVEFIHRLSIQLSPENVVPDPTLCLGVQKIIVMSADPKSPENRSNAEETIVTLSKLNQSAMESVLESMPQSIASTAHAILAARGAQGRSDERHERDAAQYNPSSYQAHSDSRKPNSNESSCASVIATLSSLESSESAKEEALVQVIQWSKETLMNSSSEATTTSEFADVLGCVVDVVGASGEGRVREKGVRALRELMRSNGGAHARETFTVETETTGDDDDEEVCDVELLSATVDTLMGLHADGNREVLRAAEECLNLLATVVEPPETLLMILQEYIDGENDSKLLASIKLETKLVRSLVAERVSPLLEHIVPGLVRAYSHAQAEVRKACVFCLVELYLSQDDALTAHLSQLTAQQMKLLDLYIKRARPE